MYLVVDKDVTIPSNTLRAVQVFTEPSTDTRVIRTLQEGWSYIEIKQVQFFP